MRLFKQIISLLLVVALFAAFNLSIYVLITRRCSGNFGTTLATKSIEAATYRPFDKNSNIVKADSNFKLTDDPPVLDGAAALLPVYAAFVNAVYPESSCIWEADGYTTDSAMQYRNTLKAYTAVVDGDADIIFCAAPSDTQKQYAADKGVTLVYEPIGYEAFVFLVNNQNPVNTLTTEQIRGIYSGKYTNWSQLGGKNRIINPLTRIEGSGSQTALLAFLNGEQIKKSPLVFFGGGLAFSFRYYVEGIVSNGDIKLLSVDGVYPSIENIKNGSYPIINEFYAVYRADNTNKNITPLIEWILSEEGQQIIEQSGYVGIN